MFIKDTREEMKEKPHLVLLMGRSAQGGCDCLRVAAPLWYHLGGIQPSHILDASSWYNAPALAAKLPVEVPC